MPIRRDAVAYTLLLGAVSAVPPLSIDMGLPGIPAIEATFADAAGQGALTLSLFLAGFAISPLMGGPLADRFGRRLTLLTGLVCFIAAAAACAAAPSFHLLLGFRLVQGLAAGACAVVPFAIVRDVFEGPVARSRLSQMATVLGIAPMLAPILGGWVMTISDWRSIYAVQALCGLALLVVAFFGLSETLAPARRRSIHPVSLLGSYRAVLTDRAFRGFALVYALGFGCMFAYISGSPGVLMGSLGLSGTLFSLLFAATACGTMVGSLISGRLSSRHVASRKILGFGLTVMAASAVSALAMAAFGTVHLYTLMPLVAVVILCFGLTGPSANHEAMHNLAHVAGAASGIMRCAQMVAGAAASALIAVFQPFGHATLVMTAIMSLSVLAAGTIFLRQMRAERRSAA